MTEQSKLRFAVGVFDNWQQLREALRDGQVRGLLLDNFNCLALERVFRGKAIAPPGQSVLAVQAMPFPDNGEPIACTAGVLANCLIERLRSGARSLKEALSRWLIPRHAAHFEDVVLAGKILIWIPVADADNERRAYESLLAHSSNSVGVHDLFVPGE